VSVQYADLSPEMVVCMLGRGARNAEDAAEQSLGSLVKALLRGSRDRGEHMGERMERARTGRQKARVANAERSRKSDGARDILSPMIFLHEVI
jgi:hypothetical protein